MGNRVEGIPSWYVASHPSQLSLLLSAGEVSTGQAALAVFFGWEGNRRPAVALAMRHRL